MQMLTIQGKSNPVTENIRGFNLAAIQLKAIQVTKLPFLR
jgi:hypothetical protein